MSYSRWGGDSYWYTFWICPRDPEKENIDTAIFEICGVTHFSAKEIRENIEKCLDKAFEETSGSNWKSHLENDRQELKECMEAFIRDVDAEYRED